MMNIFIQPYGKQMEMVFVQRVHVDKKDEMIQRRRKEVTNWRRKHVGWVLKDLPRTKRSIWKRRIILLIEIDFND